MNTNNLSQHEIGFLLIVDRLTQNQAPLNRENITSIAEIKLPGVAEHYGQIVDSLQVQGILLKRQDEVSLTEAGVAYLEKLTQGLTLNILFYGAYYQAVLTSRAHALFCERVYGKNMAQHGMADMAQLDILLEELQMTPGMSLLDFGCGDGRISEYLGEITQGYVTGIDISAYAVELALQRTESKRERLYFYFADLERSHGKVAAHYDRIIAIDSIFFAKDQQAVLERLLSMLKCGGKMGIFYISPPQMPPKLGEILKALGLRYHVRDLSALNYDHWMKKRAALLELEALFVEEGHTFLFKNRMAECQGTLEQFQRHLFIVEAP